MTRLLQTLLLCLAFGLLAIERIALDVRCYFLTGYSYNDLRRGPPNIRWIAAEMAILFSLGVFCYVGWIVVGMVMVCGRCGMGW